MELAPCSLPTIKQKILKHKYDVHCNFVTDHEFLLVPQKVAKVDVEEVSGGSDHDVVIVTIPYAL